MNSGHFFLCLIITLFLFCGGRELGIDLTKYPYYSAENLISFCKSVQDLPEQAPTVLDGLKKIIVFPENKRNFVAGFANEFLKILESKGWIVFDSITGMKTDSAAEDMGHPDIVVFYMTDFEEGSHYFYANHWKSLPSDKFAKILISEDLNDDQNKDLAEFFAKYGDAILTRYPEALTQVLKKVSKPAPCFDFFHAATKYYFDAYQPFEQRSDKALLSGALADRFYPLRSIAHNLYQKKARYLEFRPHPGYGVISDPIVETVSYARQIAKNKIGISGAGMGVTPAPYILAKTFEFPAAGVAVVMDDFVEPLMNKLGFIKNLNYISTTTNKLEDDLKFWLKPENQERLKALSEAGHKLVLERHTLEKRVEEFEKLVSYIFTQKKRE